MIRVYPGTAKRRSAGLQTGIAAAGRETHALILADYPGLTGDGETPAGRVRGEGSFARVGAPVFRPASRPQAAKLTL